MKKVLGVLSIVGLVALGLVVVQAQSPVNPQLTNGDFEAGDLPVGWRTGGTQNFSVTRVESGGNHFAQLMVGTGPTGDASCTNPFFNNFASLDQFFVIPKNQRIDLDFLVPLPGATDASEDAPCEGFDRVELDFVVVEVSPPFSSKLIGVVLIDFVGSTGSPRGLLIVNDLVTETVSFAQFDPMSFTPTSAGALSLQNSSTLPGWLHASMEVSTAFFPWLPDEITFRVTARLEDNRFTGQDFSVSVDNVSAASLFTPLTIDIKPGSDPNAINPAGRGTIPVAILTTDTFDATTVSPITVRFGPAGASLEHQLGHLEDVDGDGDLDLVLHFRTQGTSIQCGDTEASLTGETFDGQAIQGTDSIVTVGCS